MPYSNECVFLKISEDSGNPVEAPDLVDLDPSLTTVNNTSHTPSSTGHLSQSWSSAEPNSNLPTRERGSGSSYLPAHGMLPDFGRIDVPDSTSTNDMSGTSLDGGPSSRPTPNSSTASDHLAPGGGGARVNGGSGRASFEASPVASHPNLSMPGASGSAQSISNFFNDPTAYNLPGVMSETGGSGFEVGSAGWAEMPGQGTMPDPVLRSILAMGPMDTMDLGWDSTQ